jgi:hypothetical protein
MLPLETKQSGGKLFHHSDLQEGVFLGKISSSRSTARRITKERRRHPHSYKSGTWNVRTLNRGGKLVILRKEMQKNEVSVPGVSEVRWKGQDEIRCGDYTVYYSGGKRAEKRCGNSGA